MARKPEPTISAVLIVKDEEEYLARCLESVRWVDEIVVYDTGSTDRTVEIARQFTDKVIEGYWNDDFGAARNRALEYATGEWGLQVDADETFEGNTRAVRKHLASGRADVFTVPIVTRVATPGAVEGPLVSVRVYRRSSAHYAGALHEQVVPRHNRGLRSAPLPGVMIRHSGYSEGPEAMAARVQRNLAIAERELESLEADGAARPEALALTRSNLARTLSAAGRKDEAQVLAERIYQDGHLADPAMELFANAMAVTAAALADFDLARTWTDRLRDVAGNPVWADALLAQLGAMEKSPEKTLEALERIPTTVVDARGRQLRKVDLARYEVWALHELGRTAEARRIAERAARAGVLPGQPIELWEWLGEGGVADMVRVLPDASWQLLAVLCTHAGETLAARRVLATMAEIRPGDLATLLCANRLNFPADLGGLEEAAVWAARIRAAGIDDHCTLLKLANDDGVPAPQRARAAALALYAYDDARALPALEGALADVVPEDEAELAAHLDILAPGLVQRA